MEMKLQILLAETEEKAFVLPTGDNISTRCSL